MWQCSISRNTLNAHHHHHIALLNTHACMHMHNTHACTTHMHAQHTCMHVLLLEPQACVGSHQAAACTWHAYAPSQRTMSQVFTLACSGRQAQTKAGRPSTLSPSAICFHRRCGAMSSVPMYVLMLEQQEVKKPTGDLTALQSVRSTCSTASRACRQSMLRSCWKLSGMRPWWKAGLRCCSSSSAC